MAKKSSGPHGLTIDRKDAKWICEWKQPSDVTAQQFAYQVNDKGKDKWKSVDVGKGTTKKTIAVNDTSYYDFRYRVRTKQKGKEWSDWTTLVEAIKVGPVPSLSVAADEDVDNKAKFSWKYTAKDKVPMPFLRLEYQTTTTTGSAKPKWQKAWTQTTDVEGSQSYVESSLSLADKSFTRWFRIRSVTRRGHSAAKVKSYTYAVPKVVATVDATYDVATKRVSASWDVSTSGNHPVDTIEVKVAKATPNADGSCPDDASFDTTIATLAWSKAAAKSKAVVQLESAPGEDEGLFARVDLVHGHNTGYGDAVPVRAVNGKYALKAPDAPTATITDAGVVTLTLSANTAVTGAYVWIRYADGFSKTGWNSAQLSSGLSYALASDTSASFTIPNYNSAHAYAFDVVTRLAVKSGSEWFYYESAHAQTGTTGLPPAPTGLSASATSTSGTIEAAWSYQYAGSEATGCEVSWSDHEDAWTSTDEPSTHDVARTREPRLDISGLETGKTWWVRARYYVGSGDDRTYGPYCDPVPVDLSAAPTIPTLALSSDVIAPDGTTTATWVYTSGDGTAQAYAEICEVTSTDGVLTYGDVVARAQGAQRVDLSAADLMSTLGWTTGSTHDLALRVQSASERFSGGWSAPVSLTIAEPPTCSVASASLVDTTETIDPDDSTAGTRTVKVLQALPMTVTVTGGETCRIAITRRGTYQLDRPDGSTQPAYDGETIAQASGMSGDALSIGLSDLIGRLDDGAWYTLTATVEDAYGQTATDELEFRVGWSQQPVAPVLADVTAEIASDTARITVPKPTGAADTDTLDIYRLSTDAPQLIVRGGSYGVTYVDPYPACGANAGYRCVSVSQYDDYIASGGTPAWVDKPIAYKLSTIIVDFDGETIALAYNIADIESDFKKQFAATRMLGGSIVGDWAPGVERDVSANATIPVKVSPDDVPAMRRLAEHAGVCHVRTPDGSSYAADVQVKETIGAQTGDYDLTITRVAGERLDGMTLAEWTAQEAAE